MAKVISHEQSELQHAAFLMQRLLDSVENEDIIGKAIYELEDYELMQAKWVIAALEFIEEHGEKTAQKDN